jgi:hypothetical protein
MLHPKGLIVRLTTLLSVLVAIVPFAVDRGGPQEAEAGGACVAWRQTGQCAADGPREPQNDKACDVAINSGWSGFCECSTGRVGVGCGHATESCSQVCAAGSWAPAGRGACVAWRQTGQCAARGPREPQNDKACDVNINSGWSGFCECSAGTVGVGCGHATPTCNQVCAAGSWPGQPTSGSCLAWRQTGQCAANGPREPQNDKACDVNINSGWSGFCECSTGNVGVGCGHSTPTCAQVCARGGW